MEEKHRPESDAERPETVGHGARTHALINEFVRRYSKKLLTIAARMVGRHDAEDVAQNAFLNLAGMITTMPHGKAVELLESDDKLLPLMCKITSRRAYDRLRERC